MSTLRWSDDKRAFYLRVQELRGRRGELERERTLVLKAYIDAAAIRDADARRCARNDLGKRLQAVGRELNDVGARYHRSNAALRGMT